MSCTLLVGEMALLVLCLLRLDGRAQNTPFEKCLLHTFRQLIETVFSQLDGQMHIKNTGAKSV
jgi:hypothetical protein